MIVDFGFDAHRVELRLSERTLPVPSPHSYRVALNRSKFGSALFYERLRWHRDGDIDSFQKDTQPSSNFLPGHMPLLQHYPKRMISDPCPMHAFGGAVVPRCSPLPSRLDRSVGGAECARMEEEKTVNRSRSTTHLARGSILIREISRCDAKIKQPRGQYHYKL